MPNLARLVPSPSSSRTLEIVESVRVRLAHEVAKGVVADARLNSESLSIAWWFQHLSTPERMKVLTVIRDTPCECFGCLQARRTAS